MALFQGYCAIREAQGVELPNDCDFDAKLPTSQKIVDLSANENPFGPSPRALAAMMEAARVANRYPDKEGTALKSALAKHLGVQTDQIVLGNGSAELIDAIARATLRPGDEAIIGKPTFPAYRSGIARASAEATTVPLIDGVEDLDRIAQIIGERTRLIIVGNPNNPSGGTFGAAKWKEFIAQIPPRVVVVVDEAYHEYVARPDYPQVLHQITEGNSVVVLRSFSKAYGLAGLRIGYGIAPAPLRERIERQLQHFNTNRVAQAAALAALEDQEHLAYCVERNAQGRRDLHDALTAMGLAVAESQANFLLVRAPKAAEVQQALQQRGVLVKWLEGVPDAIRVSVGRPEENARFLQALAEVRAELSV